MKRLFYLSTLCFIALSVGCSYNELPEELDINLPIDDRISLNVETRAEVYNGKELDRDYFVTASDLENFVKFRRNTSKRSNFYVKEVKSYGFDSSQTLFYILNYNEGWEVVAADKRIQPTIAHGDNGEFTMDCDNEPMKFWMNMLADGILQTRLRTADDMSSATNNTTSTNSNSSTISSSEEQYVKFWKGISPITNNTKFEILTPIFGFEDSLQNTNRYFIPNATTSSNNVYSSGDRLSTQWGQWFPWNIHCPYTNATLVSRVPAGCTAVAGAQLLYELAEKGWEISSPMYAECNGYYGNYEGTQLFGNLSSNVWELMATAYNNTTGIAHYYSAALIAYIGYISNMNYAPSGSGATLAELQAGLQNYFNISSTLSNYSSTSVIAALSNAPVVISGYDDIFKQCGHSWIIEEYLQVTTYTNRYYIDTTETLTLMDLASLTIEDATGYVTDIATSQQFYMNWGWDGDYNGYFGLQKDDWQPNYNDNTTYEYYVEILRGLSLNNNAL